MDKQLMEKLTGGGMNVNDALERFLGNEDLYIKFVKKFLDDPNYNDLICSLEKGDYDYAFKCAHTLKGVAANLGFEGILEPLVPLVENLRKNDIDNQEGNINKLREKYQITIKVIEEL